MSSIDELYSAITDGDSTAVSNLISANQKLLVGDGVNPPPLHWAIFQNHIHVAELLLSAGASINQKDPDRGATPIEYATVYGGKQAIRLLIANGANPSEAIAVARKGADGGFAEFEELPSVSKYKEILDFIENRPAETASSSP